MSLRVWWGITDMLDFEMLDVGFVRVEGIQKFGATVSHISAPCQVVAGGYSLL